MSLFTPGWVVRGICAGVKALAPIKELITPSLVLLHAGVVPRAIIMHLGHKPPCNRIDWQLAHQLMGFFNIGGWPLHHQHAVSIAASTGAHGIDKRLVISL